MTSTVIMASTSSEVKASYWFPDGETGDSSESAQNIDSILFTHIFCAYADLDTDTHKVFISQAHEYIFSSFTEIVRQKNPQVQTLLSIGGKNADKSAFASMASNPVSRRTFIDSSISIARAYGFHGLDLAWEYPNNDVEMCNFGKLLEEWRTTVEDESERTDRRPLLLTAAVYYSSVYESVSYPVQVVKESLDWVNIIAYEFFGSSTTIGPPAALYNPLNPEGPCGDSGLTQWIEAGLPEKKAVFGFPYVGVVWTLEDGYDAATTRVAISAEGSINYDQIMKFIMDAGAQTFYDSAVVGNYCFSAKTLIAYDDVESVVTKVEYAKDRGLCGYFAWNVGADVNSRLSRAAWQAWDATKPLTET